MRDYFAYARVSTAKQGEHGVSLEEQRDAIRRYADRHGLHISEWFEERQTAAKRGRAVFARMLKLLRSRKAVGVIIHKVDRSARNLKDWADLGELIDDKIDVHFAHDPVDLRSRAGRLSADIQAVVAADYIRNLREETKKGFYGRLKQGLYPRPAPIGYQDQGGGQPKTIDIVQGPLVRKAFERYVTGQVGLEDLAEEMAARGLRNRRGARVSLNGLSWMLNNPFYMGLVRIIKTGDTYQGLHEPLISPTLFNAVKAMLNGRTTKGSGRHAFLFRRLLTCARCGYRLIGETHKGHVYYRCHTRECPVTSVREEAVDGALAASLKRLTFTESRRDQLVAEAQAMLEDWTAEAGDRHTGLAMRLGQVQARLARLTDGYLENTIDRRVFQERQEALLTERLSLEEKLRNVDTADANEDEGLNGILELAGTAYLAYRQASDDEKRELVEIVTSNRTVDAKGPMFTLSKPFDQVADHLKTGHGDPQRCSHRTKELLVTLNNLTKSQEFEGLFARISRFLHPADFGKSSIDREQTFPFRKKGRPAIQAA